VNPRHGVDASHRRLQSLLHHRFPGTPDLDADQADDDLQAVPHPVADLMQQVILAA
jgi:hypothetical protein